MRSDLQDGLLRRRTLGYVALAEFVLLSASKVFIARVSWSFMKTTDSALLGHVGTKYLDASALADLWMSSTSSLLLGGVVSVLSSQSIGAGDPKLAGVWLQVALVVASALLIPIVIAWFLTADVMLAFGKSQELASICGLYSRLMCIALLGRIPVYILNQYLYGVQEFSAPVRAAVVAMAVNMIGGAFFVLGWPVPFWNGFGFAACPLVTATAEFTMLYWNVRYVWKHGMREFWPGWSWECITSTRLQIYLKLYVPAALAISSDFWRMSVMGIMAASIGDNEVGVFNVSYRIMWLSLIFVGSVSEAVGVQMSKSVGECNVAQAQRAAMIGFGFCGVILVLVSVVLSLFPRALFMLFTDDPAMLRLFENSSLPFLGMLVFMNLTVYLERFPLAFSKMRDVFWIGFIGSWVFQVPFSFLCLHFWRYDLSGLYTGGFVGYFSVCVTYLVYFSRTDWEKAAEKVRETAQKCETTTKNES